MYPVVLGSSDDVPTPYRWPERNCAAYPGPQAATRPGISSCPRSWNNASPSGVPAYPRVASVDTRSRMDSKRPFSAALFEDGDVASARTRMSSSQKSARAARCCIPSTGTVMTSVTTLSGPSGPIHDVSTVRPATAVTERSVPTSASRGTPATPPMCVVTTPEGRCTCPRTGTSIVDPGGGVTACDAPHARQLRARATTDATTDAIVVPSAAVAWYPPPVSDSATNPGTSTCVPMLMVTRDVVATVVCRPEMWSESRRTSCSHVVGS